ncbi:cobalamin-dependent protein [Archangium violaceum]|uniref:cobalamin B12-binding domain-containing protein n=1 Tax=Archangium violaceum TaxID=83451 RepID=UPI00194ECF21|nr:cobalamin B12-binding domain-containing protein [Archangium violaceum]QRN96061.1 cobalamin-dependent protein [Archangium violaceum]
MERRQPPEIDLPRLLASYSAVQLAGNLRGSLRLLDEALARGASITDLQCHVIQAAQRELGQLWQGKYIGIAQEHRATAISQVALAHLFSRAQPAPSRGVSVAVACVEGELHEMAARLLSDFLELAGFTVLYLGANLPTDSLLSILEQEPPDVLALSVTMVFNISALRRAVAEVRERLGPGLPILVGGPAVDEIPGLVAELGVGSSGPTPAELESAVLRAVEQRLH